MRNTEGVAAVPRWLIRHELYRDVAASKLLLHLNIIVNYDSTTVEQGTLEPGQALVSIRGLSRETGLSKQQVETALKKLVKAGLVRQESRHPATIVTLCYWRKNWNEMTKTKTLSKTI